MNALHQMVSGVLYWQCFKLSFERNVFTDLTQIGVEEECE